MRRSSLQLTKAKYLDMLCILQFKSFMARNGLIHSMKKGDIKTINERGGGVGYSLTYSYVRGNSSRLIPEDKNFFRHNYPTNRNNNLVCSIWVGDDKVRKVFREYGIIINDANSYYEIIIFRNHILNEDFLVRANLYREIIKDANNRKEEQNRHNLHNSVMNQTKKVKSLQERFNEKWKELHEL